MNDGLTFENWSVLAICIVVAALEIRAYLRRRTAKRAAARLEP